MSGIITPDSIDFIKINMNGAWTKGNPPQDHPNFQSFVSVSSEETPQFIIHTTKKQKITLDFQVGSQVFIDDWTFRYHKDKVINQQIENVSS